MEVSTEKSKVMVNSPNNISANITMNGETLDEVTSFKYLGSTIYKDDTCTGEIRTRIATATAAMARLNRIWESNICFKTKYMLFRSLVTSILLYGCETWTILAESEKRIQVFEWKCLRRLLGIHYWERKTNEFVRNEVTSLVGPQMTLLQMVERRKLAWFGHITRQYCLSKTVM
ncbi:uncharacterized protein [Diadema antillarum]|uniref:uncharacterized protein n=1 Tax=Diadema antillarum TaxID=105358 RepID=UPI003A845411